MVGFFVTCMYTLSGSIITDVFQYIERNALYATNNRGERVVKPDKPLKVRT